MALAAAIGLTLGGVFVGVQGGGGATTGVPAATATATATATKTVSEQGEPAPTVTVTKTAKPEATKEAPPEDEITAGTYIVGQDIQPGTYKAKADEEGGLCYWSRLKKNDDIINNNVTEGRSVVTIKARTTRLRRAAAHLGSSSERS